MICQTAGLTSRSSYNDLIELFERLSNFLKRLEIYTTIPPSLLMTDLIVKITVELLSVLALATKKYQEGRFSKCRFTRISHEAQHITEQFIKKLSEEGKIVDALRKLDRLTQEDVRMAVAQTLSVVHGLVDDVNERMEGRQYYLDVWRRIIYSGRASLESSSSMGVIRQDLGAYLSRHKRYLAYNGP